MVHGLCKRLLYQESAAAYLMCQAYFSLRKAIIWRKRANKNQMLERQKKTENGEKKRAIEAEVNSESLVRKSHISQLRSKLGGQGEEFKHS